MFGLSSSKEIKFKTKISVISRKQRSLYKLIQGVLLGKYTVIPRCPAYRVIDVDDSQESRSAIEKGKRMVNGVFFDMVIIDNEGLRPICAFIMDPKGHESEENWGKDTVALYKAARSAKFPMFVVPVLQTYDTFSIVAKLRTVIPKECLIDKQREYLEGKELKDKQAALDSKATAFQADPWIDGGAGKAR